MGHDLNFNQAKGRHAMVSVKEIPWHGLGKIVNNRMTSKECIEEALMDYHVEKGKVYVKYTDPINKIAGVEVPDRYCTYRTDTGEPFSTVGSTYEIVQNIEAFNFFDSIVGERRAIYETAGALGKGETIFITAKLPDHMLIGGKDTIDQYLLFTMSHDGTGSIVAKFTPIRVVCNNTLSIALSSGKSIFRIRHSSQSRNKLQEASNLLAITYKLSKKTEDLLNHLTTIKITDEVAEKYVLDLMLNKEEMAKLTAADISWKADREIISTRKKNVITQILTYRETGAGQDMEICKGTAYGIYNTINGYLQNVKSYTNDETKFKSLTGGVDEALNHKALQLASNINSNIY
jgi:phage/plasmid-like protein (TIGR03299 family)